jgi:hypothetical protein
MDPLNEMRREMGELDLPVSPSQTPAQSPRVQPTVRQSPALASVAAAGGCHSERLDDSVRSGLLILAGLCVLVAFVHPVVFRSLNNSKEGWTKFASAILGWPGPSVQPIIAGIGIGVLLAGAVATAGFARVKPWQSNALVAITVVLVAAVLPLLVFFVLFIAFWVIAIVLGIAVIVILFAILASSG